MASSNPTYTVADVITDVNNRLANPGLSSTVMIPWVSYAYQRIYQVLSGAGQTVKEELFGDDATITMNTTSPNEYSLETNIPRFGGIIKVEVKYGASGDDWNRASKLRSIANWNIQNNVSTSYRGKTQPLYYLLQDVIGFIPTPPESGAQAKVWYIKRPQQLDATTDEIDIPYRYIWPIIEYVQAKTIQRVNEDYREAELVERNFERALEEIALAAVSEYNENDGTDAVEDFSNSFFYHNPLD